MGRARPGGGPAGARARPGAGRCPHVGRFEESLALYRTTIELKPEGSFYDSQYAVALLVAGRREEAIERVDALLSRVEALTTLEQALIGWVLARSGREAEALRIAERLEQRARGGVAWGGARAYLEMGLGRHERALSLL